MHGIRPFSKVIAAMNISAFVLFFLTGLTWWNLPLVQGIWLFWVMLYLALTLMCLSIFAQECRLPSKLYRFMMLVFIYSASIALITCIINITFTPNMDAFLTCIFSVKLYNIAKNAGVC